MPRLGEDGDLRRLGGEEEEGDLWRRRRLGEEDGEPYTLGWSSASVTEYSLIARDGRFSARPVAGLYTTVYPGDRGEDEEDEEGEGEEGRRLAYDGRFSASPVSGLIPDVRAGGGESLL